MSEIDIDPQTPLLVSDNDVIKDHIDMGIDNDNGDDNGYDSIDSEGNNNNKTTTKITTTCNNDHDYDDDL